MTDTKSVSSKLLFKQSCSYSNPPGQFVSNFIPSKQGPQQVACRGGVHVCTHLLLKLCLKSFILLALVHWIAINNWTVMSVLLDWSALVHLVISFKSLKQFQVLFGTYKLYHLITISFSGYDSLEVIKNLYVVPDSLWIGTVPLASFVPSDTTFSLILKNNFLTSEFWIFFGRRSPCCTSELFSAWKSMMQFASGWVWLHSECS